MNGWNLGAVAVAASCLSAASFAGNINISEIRVNESGVDANDYIELRSTPNTSVNGLTYVVVSYADIGFNGVIEHAYALSGQTNATGNFVAAGLGYTLSAVDQTIADFEFFSSDNKTHLLVSGFTGAIGQDLDTDDNGVFNSTPWSNVLDSVAILEHAMPDGSDGNSLVYSNTEVGPDGAFLPGHVYVCSDTLAWAVGLFQPTGQTDRPQQTNLACNIPIPNVRINEVRVDQTGTDNEESFELKGPSNQTLNGLTYIVIGDTGATTNSGVVEVAIPLTGLQIPADGHFLVVEDTHSFAPAFQVNLSFAGNGLNFENDDNVTHMLVTGFTGLNGDDLDPNDDGVLDTTPWQAVVDIVAIIRQPNPPTSTEFHYAQNPSQVVGPDIDGGSPMHVFRCEPDGTWTIGAEDIDITDTYGTLNLACAGEICGSPKAGDCFEVNASPGCNDAKCCNLVCAIDSSCCNVVWDATCVELANFNCAGGNPCGNPAGGSCHVVHTEPGCAHGTCCEEVCAIDPTCCSDTWDAACVALANNNCIVGGSPPVVNIHEVRLDEPGANVNEFFELRANAGVNLNGVAYIVIGDGETGGSGIIEHVTFLDGVVIPADGHLLVAEDTDTLGAVADVVTALNFENDDNVTHLLVFNFTGAVGNDVDGDDNGTIDLMPWTSVISSVAFRASEPPPTVPDAEHTYSPTVLGPFGDFAPAHAYRCVPGLVWVGGRFDWDANNDTIPDAADTPGVANLSCAPPSCGDPFAGDCFSANGTPGCEIGDCCTDVCTQDPFCCQVAWDDACADKAAIFCADPCGGPFAENCYQVNSEGEGGCENPVCCEIVCSIDPTCCTGPWDAACVAIAQNNCLFGGKAPDVQLNEVRIDQTGSDNDEYVEIKGAAGTSLDGVHVIVVGDGTGLSGAVEGWVDLTGTTIPADGHFLVAEPTLALVPLSAANLIVAQAGSGNSYGLNFENSDNVTVMLVYDFTGSIDTDIDTDDNGTIDPPLAWSLVIDSIALVENTDTPPTGTEWWYGPFLGPDDVFVPGHGYRCETAGTWTIGAFDPTMGVDTPGSLNEACGAASCTGDIVDSGTFQPPPDGQVDAADLAFLLGEWGPNPGSPADFVNSGTFQPPPDGQVDAADLAVLLGAWGPCP